MADPGDRDVGLPPTAEPAKRWMLRIFASSRYFAGFAVLGAFLASVTLYVYGALVVFKVIAETVTVGDLSIGGAKHLQLVFIELADVFLLGTVLLIVAFGLYQLFLHPDLNVPKWLRIGDLDDLTAKLLEVVAVMLSVTFLAYTVETGAGEDVLELGIAVAVVVGALALLGFTARHAHGRDDRPPTE